MTGPDVAATLDKAPRLVLAWAGPGGPVLLSLPFWFDSEHLWMTTTTEELAPGSVDAGAAAFVPAPTGEGGVVLEGGVRTFGAGEPLALLGHGLIVSAAMVGLALKNPRALRAFAQTAVRTPSRVLPPSRVVLRMDVIGPRAVGAPAVGPGIAPALPAEVPAAVRRLVSAQRRVLLAIATGGTAPPSLAPAAWGPGLSLDAGMAHLNAVAPAAVLVEPDPHTPTPEAGLVLSGTLEGGRLRPVRISWWHGTERGDSAVAPAATLVLPD